MKWAACLLLCSFLPYQAVFAKNNNVVNVYSWGSEIPPSVITKFEKETGIKVNYSSFDSNEIMFAKLRANAKGYDIAEPSSYFIGRMQRRGMFEKLDKSKLSNFKNLDPFFVNRPHDPNNEYSVPFLWGATGIFVNTDYFSEKDIRKWSDLLNPLYVNQLLLMNESRTVFAATMRMIGYSINDFDPTHVKQAYHKLKELMPNVRLFNNDAVISLLIDEDINVGMAFSGDVLNAVLENPKLRFIYPEDGFEVWLDSFVILKDAPHKENAYRFLNFLLRADVAKEASIKNYYSTANLAAKNSMPPELKNNPMLFPSPEVMSRAEFLADTDESSTILFEKYWQLLKMGG